jgi:chlorite dismutase
MTDEEGNFDALELALPAVPLTVEGSGVLHQIFRLRWREWKAAPAVERRDAVDEAVRVLAEMEGEGKQQTALYSMIGHKGDLLLLHFRHNLEELNDAELRVTGTKLAHYLDCTASYLSVVELSLYQSSIQLYKRILESGIQPGSEEFESEVEQALAQHRNAMAPRLWPSIPPQRYLCFYPMDRKRGPGENWYQVPIAKRERMMREHGLVGRKYARQVKQIVTSSIGLDDWEWGVDLFADDPLAFKRLIYEMRFDEASAVYAVFGPFYVGIRFQARELSVFLDGRRPPYPAESSRELPWITSPT